MVSILFPKIEQKKSEQTRRKVWRFHTRKPNLKFVCDAVIGKKARRITAVKV